MSMLPTLLIPLPLLLITLPLLLRPTAEKPATLLGALASVPSDRLAARTGAADPVRLMRTG